MGSGDWAEESSTATPSASPQVSSDVGVSHSPQTTTAEWKTKAAHIQTACSNEDIGALASLTISHGGLLTDTLRRQAWPILLGFKASISSDKESSRTSSVEKSLETLPVHRDESQVQLDVDRSFVYYPKSQTESELEARRKDLFDVIIPTLRQHPKLCYFQGFHDIAQVMLLVLGKRDAAQAASFLSLLRIRDFMLPSLQPSLVHLQLLPAILCAADPTLHRHLRDVKPFFALAATLTLYAHDVEDYGQIARLYDFLLAHEAAVSIYLFAVIILSKKEQLLAIPADDTDILNFVLSKLPKPLNLEELIANTMDLFMKYPPKILPFRAWRRITSSSVLITTQDSTRYGTGVVRIDSLSIGESLLEKQLLELEREERRQKLLARLWTYRKPVAGVVTAALVGLLSMWIQRQGIDRLSILNAFWNLRGLRN